MDFKLIINSLGIIFTMLGVWMIYYNSPINNHSIDGGGPETDFNEEERITNKRNLLLKRGVFIVLIGSLLQLISNFI